MNHDSRLTVVSHNRIHDCVISPLVHILVDLCMCVCWCVCHCVHVHVSNTNLGRSSIPDLIWGKYCHLFPLTNVPNGCTYHMLVFSTPASNPTSKLKRARSAGAPGPAARGGATCAGSLLRSCVHTCSASSTGVARVVL